VKVIAKKNSQHYSKSKKWLTINCVINATKDNLLGFYIFRGEWFKDHYIKECKAFYRYLLILNGHGSHVTFKIIGQVQTFGLDMITLSFHTSNALQPLDVSYFKPFKTAFRKEKKIFQ
jgi:hypothetical protein